MDVSGIQVSADEVNVLPFLGKIDVPPNVSEIGPLEIFLSEANLRDDENDQEVLSSPPRALVGESQFPDQSMHILDQQLKGLRESLNRIKFYMGDLDDLLIK